MTTQNVTFKLSQLSDYLEKMPEDLYELGSERGRKAANETLFKMVSKWLSRLQDNPSFQDFQVNNDPSVPEGSCREIEVVLATVEQFRAINDIGGDPLAGGASHQDEYDPFGGETPADKAVRVLWPIDTQMLLKLIEGGLTSDADLKVVMAPCIKSLFFEIERAKLFMENAKFNIPKDIAALYDAGELNNDLSDFISGYGMRTLVPWQHLLENEQGAAGADEAVIFYVLNQGGKRFQETVFIDEEPDDVLSAFGIKDCVDEIRFSEISGDAGLHVDTAKPTLKIRR